MKPWLMVSIVAAACLSGCGSKKSGDTGGGSSAAGSGAATPSTPSTPSTPATPSGGGTPLGAGLPGPAATTTTPACQAACDHRASCGLGDAAGCVGECSALAEAGALDAKSLEAYTGAACDKAKETEPQFQLAAACRHACAHRTECIPGASVKECLPDCAALVQASGQEPAAVLADYTKKDCTALKGDEPMLACLHGCTHVLGCGVAGSLQGCLSYCGEQLKAGTTVEQLAEIAKTDCDKVKQTIQLPTAAGGAGGGGAAHCTAEGVYTVCDGEMCRDRLADADMGGATADQAKQEALSECNRHMTSMVLVNQSAYRASVKQTCQITGCR